VRFLAQLQDVLIILLLIAIAIAAGLWAYGPKLQLAALRAMSSADAAVIRDGERRSIPAAEIVLGDII
jgi:Ca2+-transporting ATPase